MICCMTVSCASGAWMTSSLPLLILNLMSVGSTKLALATTVALTMLDGGVAMTVRTSTVTSPATATLASTTVRADTLRFLIFFIVLSFVLFVFVVVGYGERTDFRRNSNSVMPSSRCRLFLHVPLFLLGRSASAARRRQRFCRERWQLPMPCSDWSIV